MNGNTNHPAGHGTADTSRAGNHPRWDRSRAVVGARISLSKAFDALEGTTSKRRKKRATTSSTRSRTSRSKTSSMKKGSAAAKAWGKKMAKLRRK